MNRQSAELDSPASGSKEKTESEAMHSDTSEPGAMLMAEVIASRQPANRPASVGMFALQEFRNPSSDIFDVKSGQFKGMQVPEDLRCAIFQSNLAVKAGIIKPGEVTVRALEFEKTLKSHGYKSEAFSPGKSYPDGTYIVGEGARDGTNSRHVSMVVGGKLVHTKEGAIVNEPISNKFFPGAYDRMTVLRAPSKTDGKQRT